jgi:hypothetical protein
MQLLSTRNNSYGDLHGVALAKMASNHLGTVSVTVRRYVMMMWMFPVYLGTCGYLCVLSQDRASSGRTRSLQMYLSSRPVGPKLLQVQSWMVDSRASGRQGRAGR